MGIIEKGLNTTTSDLTAERKRREEAEVDNAALHSALGAALTILHARGLQEHAHSMTVTYEDDHPGAALLERMRALEAVLGAARVFGGNSRMLREAIATADALKEKP